MREDSLAKLDRFKGRIPCLFDNYLRIEHLDKESARSVIVEPVKEYNRRRAPGEKETAPPNDKLVEAVLLLTQVASYTNARSKV